MTPELFKGELSPFGQALQASDAQGMTLGLPHLLRGERLHELLSGLYGAQLLREQRPVLVSQWAKYYFMHLIPPVLVAALADDWHWPLALAQVAVVLDGRGVPIGVRFLAAGKIVPDQTGGPLQGFASLLDDNLQPFIERLARWGGLPRAVLWSSVGEVLERCLAHLSLVDMRLARAGWPLLEQRLRADGRRNPLYRTVRYVPQGTGELLLRQRRSCCLSHRVEWVGRCGHCPLPP